MNNQVSNCNRSTCAADRYGCGFAKAAIAFLLFLFALALGLILGAVYYETILPVLASVIAFAAAIAAVVIAILIYYYWRRR